MKKERFIVYQAYGHPDIINEAIYSILSLIRVCGTSPLPTIVVYTDNIAAFSLFNSLGDTIRFELLNSKILEDWWGPQHFVHRAKICMLKDFFSKYSGTVVYTDSDVVFKTNPETLFEKIGQGTFLMHAFEGTIRSGKTPILKKLRAFFKKPIDLSGEKLFVPGDTGMWNAGVIGLTSDSKSLLDKVLSITDHTFRLCPKHIMEQFAFSFVLSDAGTVYPTEKEVFHYWNFKEFRPVLAGFFHALSGKPLEAHLGCWDQINPMLLEIPKREYEALPGIIRSLKKLSGKRWEMPPFSLPMVNSGHVPPEGFSPKAA